MRSKLLTAIGFLAIADAAARTVMAPVDAFTRDNGCLEVAREATQTAFLPQNPDGTLRAEQVARFAWEPVLAAPGDLIVFDSFIPHRSEPNRSVHNRRVMFFTFNLATDGDHYATYYRAKREDPNNPMFHVSTPTAHNSLHCLDRRAEPAPA